MKLLLVGGLAFLAGVGSTFLFADLSAGLISKTGGKDDVGSNNAWTNAFTISQASLPDRNDEAREYRFVDLNADGDMEIMSRHASMMECTTEDCAVRVYSDTTNNYGERDVIMEQSTQVFPIVLATQTNGFYDLQLAERVGSAVPSEVTIWKWDGTQYVIAQ